jgi:hypothetical protein
MEFNIEFFVLYMPRGLYKQATEDLNRVWIDFL